MNSILKYFTFTIFFLSLSCKSQNTATLQQMEECSRRPNRGREGCPDLQGVKFVKDTDNRLDRFVGTWKGTFNGKQVELKLEKKEDFGRWDVKWDKLMGKIRVKDNQGNIIFDSFQDPEEDANPYGVNFQGSSYEMRFSGKDECEDYGILFININSVPINGTKMKLHYFRDGDVVDTATCPTLLPENDMELTKQKAL